MGGKSLLKFQIQPEKGRIHKLGFGQNESGCSQKKAVMNDSLRLPLNLG